MREMEETLMCTGFVWVMYVVNIDFVYELI